MSYREQDPGKRLDAVEQKLGLLDARITKLEERGGAASFWGTVQRFGSWLAERPAALVGSLFAWGWVLPLAATVAFFVYLKRSDERADAAGVVACRNACTHIAKMTRQRGGYDEPFGMYEPCVCSDGENIATFNRDLTHYTVEPARVENEED